jgi:16S rRNA G966 N2-methylase RsmD
MAQPADLGRQEICAAVAAGRCWPLLAEFAGKVNLIYIDPPFDTGADFSFTATRQEPKLELETKHAYDAPGEYTVVVKVIDILGNDTTKTVKVKVR